MRSSPDKSPYNNYSFPGNTNPYTGKVATGNPETYLGNYTGSNSQGYENVKVPNLSYGGNSVNQTYGTTSELSYIRDGDLVKVYTDTPLRAKPDAYSDKISNVSGIMKFIQNANNQYLLVECNGVRGYVSKGFVSSMETLQLYEEKKIERLKKHANETYSKYADSLNKEVAVFLYSPIQSEPRLNAKIIENADDEKVILLRVANENYFYVKSGKKLGYMKKTWINIH